MFYLSKYCYRIGRNILKSQRINNDHYWYFQSQKMYFFSLKVVLLIMPDSSDFDNNVKKCYHKVPEKFDENHGF